MEQRLPKSLLQANGNPRLSCDIRVRFICFVSIYVNPGPCILVQAQLEKDAAFAVATKSDEEVWEDSVGKLTHGASSQRAM